MTVTERAPLNRALIAETALSLIDERGLDQLSMRKLGAELGVEAMSLYNHVANKDDLLDAVADRLYEHILDAYTEPDGPWRVRAAEMALSYVSVAAVHPNAFPLLVGRPPVSRGEQRFSTGSLRSSTGLPTTSACRPRLQCRGELGGRHARAAGKFGEELPDLAPDGEFARVATFRRELLVNLSREERFAEGLETVLDGIEARYFSAERYP